jgi:uncharacterized protein (UPF0332 family)
MTALWTKAQVAARSARLLLEAGDTSGAINRAYYAMFSAARAALASIRSSLALSKHHGTIFRRVQKHLVQERGLDPSLGRAFLSRQSGARRVADYGDRQVDTETARKAVGDMASFLAAIEPLLAKVKR